MSKPITRRRSIINWLALSALLWISLELVALSGLEILDTVKDLTYEPVRFELTAEHRQQIEWLVSEWDGITTLSPELGWTNKPNSKQKTANKDGEPLHTIRINSSGLRSTREYPLIPDSDRIRILAFGDSFTFGAGVGVKECWTECLSSFAPQVELLNFGVPGFSLDQALLRYEKEGKPFNPRVVFMGFLSNSIEGQINVFRPFLNQGGLPAAKPRFRLNKGTLELLPNPLPTSAHYEILLEDEANVISRLGKFDRIYQRNSHAGRFDLLPSVRLAKILRRYLHKNRMTNTTYLDQQFNTGSEAFQITVKLFERFAETVTGDGSTPVAVIFPHGDDIKRFHRDRTASYTPLLEELERRGIQCVDLMAAFARAGRTHPPDDFLSPEGQYSPLGNLIVAHHLWQHLEAHELLN